MFGLFCFENHTHTFKFVVCIIFEIRIMLLVPLLLLTNPCERFCTDICSVLIALTIALA